MTPTLGPSFKVLHILYHSLPPQSGYAFRSHDILQAQSKQGWEVAALTAPQVEKSSFSNSRESIGGFLYYRSEAVPAETGLFRTERRLMRTLTRRLREVAELEKPDLLHAHSPVLNAIAALQVGRERAVPVVYEIRAFWEDAAANHGSYRSDSRKYQLTRSLETRVCHAVNHIVVISQGIKNDLIARGVPAQKLTLVPNGVDIDHFKSRPPDFRYSELWRAPGKKVIGFIGSFFKYEGIDLLLEAVAGLTAARSDIGLVLAGGGRTEAELKNQVERLRLTDRVIMPGQIPHESIPSVYSVCDILAYPRYASRLTELTTPLKPLEAMAMGKPVVASDIGGHRELIQHGRTGLLFGPGEAPSLAEAISRLLDNPALGRALGTRASIWARQTRAWDKIAGIYTDVYAKAGYLRRPRIAES